MKVVIEMSKSAFNFIGIMSLLILSSCASKTYEWVKINPGKTAMQKTSGNIKRVNVLVNAKYKAEDIIYVDNSVEYFSKYGLEEKSIVRKTIKRRALVNKAPISANKVQSGAVLTKPNSFVKTPKPAIQKVEDNNVAISKLNSSLILPKKKKVMVERSAVSLQVSKPVKKPVPTTNNTEELSYDNGLKMLEDQDNELKSNELVPEIIQEKAPEISSEVNYAEDQPISDNQIKEEGSKRNSYMWVGLVLLIVGLIIGLIFGGMAYLISIVGIVFLLMGYFTKI